MCGGQICARIIAAVSVSDGERFRDSAIDLIGGEGVMKDDLYNIVGF